MMKKKLPKFLQPFLWSVRISDLDLEEDKIYIIHQLLSFGNTEALKWLFENYPLAVIKKVFLEHPIRIYRDSGLNFVQKIILNTKIVKDEKKYVATSPTEQIIR